MTATRASSRPGCWAASTSDITPGGSEEYFKDGDRIEFVQDAIVLENLISKYLFSQAGKQSEHNADSTTEPPAAKE